MLNYSTYEYYLNDDEPEKVTRKSIVSWLNNLADGIEKGTASAHGGGFTENFERSIVLMPFRFRSLAAGSYTKNFLRSVLERHANVRHATALVVGPIWNANSVPQYYLL